MDNEIEELLKILKQPRRVHNPYALHAACEKAARIIEDMTAKKKPAKRSKKSADAE